MSAENKPETLEEAVLNILKTQGKMTVRELTHAVNQLYGDTPQTIFQWLSIRKALGVLELDGEVGFKPHVKWPYLIITFFAKEHKP